MNRFKEIVRRVIRSTGYDVVPYKVKKLGSNPFQDMEFFLQSEDKPVVLDVGANVGQSIKRFKDVIPRASIHSFEPSPSTYDELMANCKKMSWENVNTWNLGVGSQNGKMTLIENRQSYMSSFLPPGELCTGEFKRETEVETTTLDSFVEQQDIPFVHVLKSDTQGYDFEVFKGAQSLMEESRIGMIYYEVIFSRMYENLPAFYDVFRFLLDMKFTLIAFYEPHFQRHCVSWTDALFVSNSYLESRASPGST